MIISVSGAQGQGKSTVLSALEARGHKVLPNKTAREILKEWDVTLSYVYSKPELSKQFHETIVDRHSEVCLTYINTSDVVFIERSYADIFAYGLCVLGSQNGYSEWLDQFYHRCKDEQSKFAAAVYLTGREYVPESDGVRSTNLHYTDLIDTTIKRYLNRFSDESMTHKVFTVSSASTENRVAHIESIIETYFSENK